MNAPPNIKAQLQSLRISKEQRPEGASAPAAAPPAAAATAPAGRSRRGGGWTRGLVWLLVLAVVGVCGMLAVQRYGGGLLARFTGDDPAELNVKIVQAVSRREEPGSIVVFNSVGKIVSDHRVQVVTKVSGQIVALLFEQGDRVTKGQTLARIEDRIYRARRDEAVGLLAKARANLNFREINFARVKKMYEQSQVVPEIEMAEARRALDDAKAQVAADEAALNAFQKNLEDCEVVAPIAGRVLERNVEVGDFVAAEGGRGANANAQFASIADMTQLRVEVDVSEQDIARLRPRQRCTVTPDAYKERRYPGYVMWIDPGANYSKATVQVKVRIEQPDDHLRVEGSAAVAFLADPPASQSAEGGGAVTRVWIPRQACRTEAGGKEARVYLVSDGRLHESRVSTGLRIGDEVEVTAGLSGGENLAAGDVDKFSDGMRVPRRSKS
ncbi:MAG: efflux RND transporter periplasmic adaptor subunit [Phycisphaerae bacterium]